VKQEYRRLAGDDKRYGNNDILGIGTGRRRKLHHEFLVMLENHERGTQLTLSAARTIFRPSEELWNEERDVRRASKVRKSQKIFGNLEGWCSQGRLFQFNKPNKQSKDRWHDEQSQK
jgi:hypothetical protein